MPIYEYQCTVCGYIQEEYLSIIKQPNKLICDKCGKKSISGTTNIIFKGDNWADKRGKKK